MRISHLRQREPIDQIVASTLSRFWTARFGQEYLARWQTDNPRSPTNTWVCNAWLNVIFPPNVQPAAFEPIYREFSRSTVAWRRPLQKLYVRLATTRPFARWLAHGTLHVSHQLPAQEDTIVVPGNNKLRILLRDQDRCYGLLKESFPAERYLRELDARTAADEAGVRVPHLIERNDEQGWFSEQYVAGTPVNRLSDNDQRQTAVVEAANSLRLLVASSAETVPTATYVNDSVTAALNNIETSSLLDNNTKQSLRAHLDTLQQRVLNDGGAELSTSLTHGDFQPANILVSSDEVWIIDWEYAQRRQSCFDALTYTSASRSPVGLCARLHQLAASPTADQNEIVAALALPGLDWQQASGRTSALNLFMLEEMCFHLQENDNPMFRRLNHGFHSFAQELEAWLTS